MDKFHEFTNFVGSTKKSHLLLSGVNLIGISTSIITLIIIIIMIGMNLLIDAEQIEAYKLYVVDKVSDIQKNSIINTKTYKASQDVKYVYGSNTILLSLCVISLLVGVTLFIRGIIFGISQIHDNKIDHILKDCVSI